MLATDQIVLTISELNARSRKCLEQEFQVISVIGEISNLAQPGSGHIYLSLKDDKAQIRCAFFKPLNHHLTFTLENGQQVLALARVSVYEPRGDFQLIIQRLELVGDGRLQYAFEQLKRKLNLEGIFNNEYKQALPSTPNRIGIITSPTGAAIQDILKVLQRRFPAMPIVIYPCIVQGEKAANSIINAIRLANQRGECDTLIIARGGGSLEDLWPFNEESVARALFESKLPIISGIGHEVDTTISDLAADLRAATPSAAAEIATPMQQDLLLQVSHLQQRFFQHITQDILRSNNSLTLLKQRLTHPKQRLQQHMQRLDELLHRIQLAISTQVQAKQQALQKAHCLLQTQKPQQLIKNSSHTVNTLRTRLVNSIQSQLEKKQQHTNTIAYTLNAHSPLQTLERGYSIVTQDNKIIRNASTVKCGDRLNIQLKQGNLTCTVNKINHDGKI